jgi:hypothetical protein
MELNMKNVVYILAIVGAIVLMAIGKDLEYISGAILLILAIYEKYNSTQEKKEKQKIKDTFHKAMGMTVSDYEELK